MKFGFLVHPLGNETDRVIGYLRDVDLQQSFSRGIGSLFHDLHVAMELSKHGSDPAGTAAPQVRVIDEFVGLRSQLDASTDGRLYEIPMHSFAILDDPTRAMEYMLQATELAHSWGAKIVGLGAMTGIVGGQGTYLAERSPVAITTGNGLTVYAAVANLKNIARDLDIDLAREAVTIIGVPGSIATASARIIRDQCRSLTLVARRPSPRAIALAKELDADLQYDVQTALASTRIVLSATSSGGCINQKWLQPGTIVSDVGVPTDTIGSRSNRSDVLILSGGLCRVPDSMPRTSHYLWFHRGSMAACVAETVVLALDDATDDVSLGRDLDIARIESVGQRAEAHGFDFSRPFAFGQPLDDSTMCTYRKTLYRQRSKRSSSLKLSTSNDSQRNTVSSFELGTQAQERFRRHLNPTMLAVGSGLIKTFVHAQGSTLWDSDGKRYLDFLAGYGSVNLGHNHPQIVRALHSTMDDCAPGFSPAAVNPYAAALATDLAAIAPGSLEMVFFANSGAEAVEAALKLARRASGRHGFLYCEGSYHGKTLGALSVTGNQTYQRPFGPLLDHCDAVPFGDIDLLARALSSRRYAAFVVEPIQGEGGIIEAPRGYLRTAQELCREAGTLLIVDEIQTGLGRTGSMFAVDQLGVEPDIMTIAKSLGGGIVPIGAMLSRRDLWKKAYGNVDSFSLHTSTFGGGSLACAAGLATLGVLRDSDVIANAAARGRQLKDGLQSIAANHHIVRDIRGLGLLLGIELEPPPTSIIGLLQGLIANGAGEFSTPALDENLQSLSATWIMALLMQEHGIYTQVARSRPNVLRIEPPLILAAGEAQHFLDAFEQCCQEIESAYLTFDQMVAKAVRGEHGAEQVEQHSSSVTALFAGAQV